MFSPAGRRAGSIEVGIALLTGFRLCLPLGASGVAKWEREEVGLLLEVALLLYVYCSTRLSLTSPYDVQRRQYR